ncbi:hypothetical protein CDD80_5229 [Ophiocordyceps camponoti-rufipedis]|uniref:Uncharacterized protein n=1 Tax=Ophiocordyceps camponoti-rufipedis TaxID=2004952 RepID=A0A2C5YRW1_9HYPO|nr:hypothetical protein CDD80_5229 [Ophiocordyceps camponoti-rufipedis]
MYPPRGARRAPVHVLEIVPGTSGLSRVAGFHHCASAAAAAVRWQRGQKRRRERAEDRGQREQSIVCFFLDVSPLLVSPSFRLTAPTISLASLCFRPGAATKTGRLPRPSARPLLLRLHPSCPSSLIRRLAHSRLLRDHPSAHPTCPTEQPRPARRKSSAASLVVGLTTTGPGGRKATSLLDIGPEIRL